MITASVIFTSMAGEVGNDFYEPSRAGAGVSPFRVTHREFYVRDEKRTIRDNANLISR